MEYSGSAPICGTSQGAAVTSLLRFALDWKNVGQSKPGRFLLLCAFLHWPLGSGSFLAAIIKSFQPKLALIP